MLLSLFLLTCLLSHFALASSHSEAPSTAVAAGADITDFYMFRSYEDDVDAVTFIINSSPLQSPWAGPNYYGFSPTHFYQLHLTSGCVEEHVFSFYFGSELGGGVDAVNEYDFDGCTHTYNVVPVANAPAGHVVEILNADGSVNTETHIPLKALGTYVSGTEVDSQNFFEFFHLDYSTTSRGDRENLAQRRPIPYPNVGEKTFPPGMYDAYLEENDGFIHEIGLGSFCPGQNARVFAGQRADSFSVNLGRIFDNLNMNPIPGFSDSVVDSDLNNMLRDKNVQTIALEIPLVCFDDFETNGIISAWTTTSELYHNSTNDDHLVGAQFSRLGNPLVNEVAIGLKDKQLFSISEPILDGQFGQYVLYPSLPAIINAVFLPVVQARIAPSLENLAPTNLPRQDLIAIFLTGVLNLNQPANNSDLCEVMRLNTNVAPVAAIDQRNMGVVALDIDAAGYPNGRRPGDDVVDISLRAMMGVMCARCAEYSTPLGYDVCDAFGCTDDTAPVGAVELLDGAPQNAGQFQEVFPYLQPPHSGQTTNVVRGSSRSSSAAAVEAFLF